MFVDQAGFSWSHLKLTLRMRLYLIRVFGLFAVRGVRLIKVEDWSIVLKGWLHGEQVIFKRYLRPNAADIVNRAADELRFLETNLKAPFFANRCIATAPAIGVIVLGCVPGKALHRCLFNASESERTKVLQMAGAWLSGCVDLRSSNRPLRPRKFLRQLQELGTQGISSEDRAIIAKMLEELGRLGRQIDGKHLAYTISHDDMSLTNLFYFTGEIHAIDINGASWLPVMCIAARFLAMKDLYSPVSEVDMLNGLDAGDADQFLSAAGVAVAQKRVVRFFVGDQMVRIFLNRKASPDKCAIARKRMTAFLAPSGAGAAKKSMP